MNDIAQLRERIDAVDREIVRLLNERCRLVCEVGEWKREKRLPIYVPERERELLDKLAAVNTGPLEPESLVAIYREIMSAAIKLEQSLSIGCTAPPEGFPQQTVLEKFGHGVRQVEFKSLPELFSAVERGEVDYAIVPVESTSCGVVSSVLDALADSSVRIVTEFTAKMSGGGRSRFLIVGLQDAEPTGDDKCSICFSLPDRAGTLYEALRPLCENNINLTLMETRPMHRDDFEYRFFIDLAGHRKDETVSRALAELKSKCAFFRILGSYPRMV